MFRSQPATGSVSGRLGISHTGLEPDDGTWVCIWTCGAQGGLDTLRSPRPFLKRSLGDPKGTPFTWVVPNIGFGLLGDIHLLQESTNSSPPAGSVFSTHGPEDSDDHGERAQRSSCLEVGTWPRCLTNGKTRGIGVDQPEKFARPVDFIYDVHHPFVTPGLWISHLKMVDRSPKRRIAISTKNSAVPGQRRSPAASFAPAPALSPLQGHGVPTNSYDCTHSRVETVGTGGTVAVPYHA